MVKNKRQWKLRTRTQSEMAKRERSLHLYWYKVWKNRNTPGPRYWNIPVHVNTGTFVAYQYCVNMWYSGSLGVLLSRSAKNDLVVLFQCSYKSVLFPVGIIITSGKTNQMIESLFIPLTVTEQEILIACF